MGHGNTHSSKAKKNQPDILQWNHELKTCQIIEISVQIDTNLKEARHQKEIKYIPLIAEMQRMYTDYKFSTSVITIGALGAVPKNLDLNLRKVNFEKKKLQYSSREYKKQPSQEH